MTSPDSDELRSLVTRTYNVAMQARQRAGMVTIVAASETMADFRTFMQESVGQDVPPATFWGLPVIEDPKQNVPIIVRTEYIVE